MKTLKPSPLKESDYADIRAQLRDIFFTIIFKPALRLLSPHNKQVKIAAKGFKNAVEDPIISGLKSGLIQYNNGEFTGEFNASISKALRALGGKLNKQTKVYTLTPDLVPATVKAMAKTYKDEARRLHDELDKLLADTEDGLDALLDRHEIDASVVVGKMDRDFKKMVGDALAHTELSDEAKADLEKKYTDNLKPHIKKFAADTIRELRESVEANSLEGYRFDHLVERFQTRYEVSRSKAEFLASNETSRYVSQHRESMLSEAGVDEYIWMTAGDSRVREDHRKLNGRRFKFSEPPIVDEATGERANPGMFYRCRCLASPILPKFVTGAKAEAVAK